MSIPSYQPPGYGGEHVPSQNSPGVHAFLHHLLAEFPGSKNLGIFSNRSVRNGRSKSLHAVARAVDWGYDNRDDAVAVYNAITANNGALAEVLGIQAVHDYHIRENNGAHWGRHPARARSWGHGRGEHWSSVGPGDKWLHIEFHVDSAHDAALMDRVLRTGLPTHAPDVHQATEEHHDSEHHHAHEEAKPLEASMLILDLNPGTPQWVASLVAGNELTHLVNGHHVAVLERGHVPRVTLSEEEMEGVLLSVRTTNASPFGAGGSHNAHLDQLWNGVLAS